MKEVAIGIDIGGTNSVLGIIDREGNCLAESCIPTQTHSEVEMFLKDLAHDIHRIIDDLNEIVTIKGVGIGAPNGNYYNGTIEYAPNLVWKGVLPLVELMKKYVDFPAIVLTNDANAAAIGEMIYGGAQGMKDFIMITLGTGVGSGIVVNGNLVYGHDGFAGEIGTYWLIRWEDVTERSRGQNTTYCYVCLDSMQDAEPLIVLKKLKQNLIAGTSYLEGLELELEDTIDFTDPNDPHPSLEGRVVEGEAVEEVATPRIVRKDGLTYREITGDRRGSYLSYRLEFRRPVTSTCWRSNTRTTTREA